MSFTNEVKSEIVQTVPKQQCCRRAAADGIWHSVTADEAGCRKIRVRDDGTLYEYIRTVTELGYGKNRVALEKRCGTVAEIRCTGIPDSVGGPIADPVCKECRMHFLRGWFLAHGRVTVQRGGYFLEWSFDDPLKPRLYAELLSESFPEPRCFRRNGSYVLYYKNSETIGDVLAMLGCNRAAFDLINAKIERQLLGDANRYSNTSAANLAKAVANAKKQIDAIRFLDERGRLNQLSPDLLTTARLRLENPELTLAELSRLSNPPVSKSGLYHRLTKLVELAGEEQRES